MGKAFVTYYAKMSTGDILESDSLKSLYYSVKAYLRTWLDSSSPYYEYVSAFLCYGVYYEKTDTTGTKYGQHIELESIAYMRISGVDGMRTPVCIEKYDG